MVSANAFPVMGGTETHIYEVAPRIAAAGFDVTILTTDLTGSLPRRDEMRGVPVQRVRAWPTDRDYYWAPGVYRTIRRERWDLVHCQGYHTLVPPVAMAACLRSGTPYVLTFHSGGHDSALRQRLRGPQHLVLRPLLARARKLIAVSHFEVEHFSREMHVPRERFVMLRNGAAMAAPADPVPINDARPLILSVGRLERYKGHHLVIDALPYVLRALPGARLRIVGVGPFEGSLRARAAASPVSERIEIGSVDPLDRQGMARTLAGASAVALLSEYEANPVAVMEALALGRRVLVADTSGMSELARDALAAAVPIDATPEQIGRALVDLIGSPEPPALRLPTWDECAARLADVYREALAA